MLKQYFVKHAIKELEIEEFIKHNFPMGDYSKIEMQRTPLGIKILIHTNKPGRIIGRSGRNINEMTDAIRQRFGLENPQLDVKIIRDPDLDAKIVAKQIASSIERGFNYKKIGNLTIKRIMEAGAVGAEIIISGKFGTGKGMTSKFVEGYLKHCGQSAKELVDYGFEEITMRPGKIGIQVKIMRYFMGIDGQLITKAQEKEMEKKGEDIVEQLEVAEAEQAPAAEETAQKETMEGRRLKTEGVADAFKPSTPSDHKQPKKASKPRTKEGRRHGTPSDQESEKVKKAESKKEA